MTLKYPVLVCPKCDNEIRDGYIAVYKQTHCSKCGEALSTYSELTKTYYIRSDITYRIKEVER
jgi:hypothetical protein